MEFLQTQLRSLQKLTRRVDFFFSHKDEDKKKPQRLCNTLRNLFYSGDGSNAKSSKRR